MQNRSSTIYLGVLIYQTLLKERRGNNKPLCKCLHIWICASLKKKPHFLLFSLSLAAPVHFVPGLSTI